ncbi:hypothetical protein C8R45DRAFT_1207738 [Mycena sanguinolenta]|nr:hypothetical protein C8R45DRAFT_1207738 [Mycena sanguinolenta]
MLGRRISHILGYNLVGRKIWTLGRIQEIQVSFSCQCVEKIRNGPLALLIPVAANDNAGLLAGRCSKKQFFVQAPMQDVVSSPSESPWSFLMKVLSVAGVSLVLYGIYLNLFLLSIYILARRRKTHGIKLLMAWSCLFAVVGTAQVAGTIVRTVAAARFVQESDLSQVQVSKPGNFMSVGQDVLGAMNNFATDSLYLYRCYVIWEHRWKVLILPGLFMFATFGVATNLIFTTLTAGRLLWIRRTASSVGANNQLRSRCNRAIGIVLESGAIYCIATIFFLITASLHESEAYAIELGFGTQLLNLIPTFTLVYVGLDDTKPQKAKENGGEHV